MKNLVVINKNKGFTLTEVIGVVIILGLIALIAFPTILNLVKDTEGKLDEATETLIKTAANQYMTKYESYYSKNSPHCITIRDLVKNSYLPSTINLENLKNGVDTKIKITFVEDKYVYEINDDCTDVPTSSPVITIANRNGSFNEYGWANKDFYVDITASNADGYKYCMSDAKCEPKTYQSTSQGSVLISSEGNNYVCAQASNAIGTSDIVCSSLYMLDKTAPTVGDITISGTKGTNNWYTTNVTIGVTDGSDVLSGHDKTTANVSSITANTSGTNVLITTYDKAGNTSSKTTTVKVDKNSPTIEAKQSSITINKGDSNVIKNYFTPSYSTSGGSVSCNYENTSSLSVGTHTVSCTATGGNGKTATASISIIVNQALSFDLSVSSYYVNVSNITGATSYTIKYAEGLQDESYFKTSGTNITSDKSFNADDGTYTIAVIDANDTNNILTKSVYVYNFSSSEIDQNVTVTLDSSITSIGNVMVDNGTAQASLSGNKLSISVSGGDGYDETFGGDSYEGEYDYIGGDGTSGEDSDIWESMCEDGYDVSDVVCEEGSDSPEYDETCTITCTGESWTETYYYYTVGIIIE